MQPAASHCIQDVFICPPRTPTKCFWQKQKERIKFKYKVLHSEGLLWVWLCNEGLMAVRRQVIRSKPPRSPLYTAPDSSPTLPKPCLLSLRQKSHPVCTLPAVELTNCQRVPEREHSAWRGPPSAPRCLCPPDCLYLAGAGGSPNHAAAGLQGSNTGPSLPKQTRRMSPLGETDKQLAGRPRGREGASSQQSGKAVNMLHSQRGDGQYRHQEAFV